MSSLIRWQPMAEMTRLQQEMNRLIEDFFGEPVEKGEMMRIPNVDVVDRENDILVRAEMPGIDKDNIQIQAMPESLMIRAEMRKEAEEKAENYLRHERRVGTFQRVIPMPEEIKPDDVKAAYKDGVLEITLPKSESARARKPVKVAIE